MIPGKVAILGPVRKCNEIAQVPRQRFCWPLVLSFILRIAKQYANSIDILNVNTNSRAQLV